MPTIVSKEQYFESALDVLADIGFTGLNIGLLCRTLGVTSGSFYHHFGSWDGFVESLLEFWEQRQAVALRDKGFGSGDARADITALRSLSVTLNHRAEAGIRAWGLNNEMVRAGVLRIDEIRYRTVHKAVSRIVADDDTATVVTEFGLSMLVGYQQLLNVGRTMDAGKLLDEYVRLIFTHSRLPQPVQVPTSRERVECDR